MTITGNAMGLSKSSTNAPGTNGSIGTFSTTDTSVRENSSWGPGTTGDWTKNSAAAVLRLPAGSAVLYAELVWGGSYRYGGEDVSAHLNSPVTLTTPMGSYSVTPAASTAKTTGGSEYYYVRSADVTARVQAGGAGTYVVAGVPGTQATSENNANAAGWALIVIYGNPSLPARNMTVFVGCELTSSSVSTTSTVSGFCTPTAGPIHGRLMVCAIEGDSNLSGD